MDWFHRRRGAGETGGRAQVSWAHPTVELGEGRVEVELRQALFVAEFLIGCGQWPGWLGPLV